MYICLCGWLQVMFGTSDGQMVVMSSTGAMLAQVTVQEGQELTNMAWSCEKFYLSEADAQDDTSGGGCDNSHSRSK